MCIWLTPISAAISDWVLLRKKRRSRIRFSRLGSASSSGLIDSRISTCSSSSSSSPYISIIETLPSSALSWVASRLRAE
jgi:hypothetical protein